MEKRKWATESGVRGPHGIRGTYGMTTEEAAASMARHLSYCNQCREERGMQLLPDSPHPAPSEYHIYE